MSDLVGNPEGRFVSDLVENPEDLFSRVTAQIFIELIKKLGHSEC